MNARLCRRTQRGLTFAAVDKVYEALVVLEMDRGGADNAINTSVEYAQPICREAANGFEGAFEALTNKATCFAGSIGLSVVRH